ncbi:type VI secretion system protein TssA [Pantoea sp. SS70]|uniref:type VI secretion system protein TssA n=1 Tax=Pantoea sp. SS70 TaxID=3024247 RepID=UPI00245312A2|nr:type VI secretion system protein TssA [Pantoea sp. SS70]WGK60099.1 type VI secretion system protein TssA [Pantoea sp. SS70]
MSTKKSYDLAALLQPISPEAPAGSNIEYEPICERIRQARISDPDFMPADEWSSAPRKADWVLVARLSEEVLVKHSKDFQIACWLVEAWTQINQIAGLRAGLDLLGGLVREMWQQSWPLLEEEGAGYRHGMISRLDRDLAQILLMKPVLGDVQSSLVWWQSVLSFEHQSGKPSDEEHAEDFSMAAFMRWASQLNYDQIAAVMADVDQCQHLITQLEQDYAALNPEAKGSLFYQSAELLSDLQDLLTRISQQIDNDAQQEELMTLNVLDFGAVNHTQKHSDEKKVMSRDLAITQMLTIAHYFRQTEPSSPVPMLMERAARWANMPLADWLEEMVGDERSLQEINFVLLGPKR